MSRSFVESALIRAVDVSCPGLPVDVGYRLIASQMHHIVHDLLVNNVDPCTVNAGELLSAMQQSGTSNDWASHMKSNGLSSQLAVLDAAQCANLRAAVDANTDDELDSVDGQLEHQLSLSTSELTALVGEETVADLNALASQRHGEMTCGVDARDYSLPDRDCSVPDDPHQIFIRRYSASTRPWCEFHHDRSKVTVNIALSADSTHTGGRLLAVLQGRVQRCERLEGTATLHASTLLHAVTRMTAGTRYSLILFYGRICPWSNHALVKCDAATMALLYPVAEGSYSCDACGGSADELGHPAMWHCAEGCEYDVCHPCHAGGCEYR